MSDRPHNTDRLVEVGNVNTTRAVDRKRERVIQARICGWPAVPGVACESVPSHGSDQPVEIDPANALAEHVAEKEVTRGINGESRDESQFRFRGGPTVADIAVGRKAEWIPSRNGRLCARG